MLVVGGDCWQSRVSWSCRKNVQELKPGEKMLLNEETRKNASRGRPRYSIHVMAPGTCRALCI